MHLLLKLNFVCGWTSLSCYTRPVLMRNRVRLLRCSPLSVTDSFSLQGSPAQHLNVEQRAQLNASGPSQTARETCSFQWESYSSLHRFLHWSCAHTSYSPDRQCNVNKSILKCCYRQQIFLSLITHIYILLGVNRASSIYRHNSEEIHEANSRFNMASKTAEKSLWDTCGPYKTINISKQMLAEHLWLQIHNIQELAKAVWKSLQLQHWPCTDETLNETSFSAESPHEPNNL